VTLDTSSVLAIMLEEPEIDEFSELIAGANRRIISTVSVLEASMVLEGRMGVDATMKLDLFLHRASIEVVPFDIDQLGVARLAFRRYGKGRHPAGLNFGDCAAYALSQWTGEPLLFKGGDFAVTDVASAREVK
jgi:ribonuclease VapC